MEGEELKNTPKDIAGKLKIQNDSIPPEVNPLDQRVVSDSVVNPSETDPDARQAQRIIREINTIKESKDNGSQISKAEEIACFRAEATEAIVLAPPADWDDIYSKLLTEYPEIKDYTDIFQQVLENAKKANKDLNEFWRKYQAVDEGFRDKYFSQLESASSQASKEMFNYLFSTKVSGEVESVKGATTLRFILQPQDFNQVAFGTSDGELVAGGFAARIDGLAFPIIVFPSTLDESSSMYATAHEIEHGFNSYAKSRYQGLISENYNIEKALLSRLGKRAENPNTALFRAKDELLAYFTMVELFLGSPDINSENLDDMVENVHQYTTSTLIDDSEDGIYLPQYEKLYGNVNKQEYIDRINSGSRALVELFKVYQKENSDRSGRINPARMAINVLEQFPLKSWPAVVRLIQSKHMKDAQLAESEKEL